MKKKNSVTGKDIFTKTATELKNKSEGSQIEENIPKVESFEIKGLY